ncbi:MAG TPA: 30S ribosomal protein S17 [Candidatus Pacearchaeota archaeon]|nr:30S ribosomal protein S17 [Candidatus Pacearchaeota archaeon]HOK94048.1 30S ribosomal protein S17 [Candidatus Pacearchaeota archaeon]HPO75119.1 30S ribosomal protein S17 [Candidatus Pacearchaeota archaeon]
MSKKQLQGIVVSNKMQKTVVVEVEQWAYQKKYKKRYKTHKRYKAHNENNNLKIGDKVTIEETRPISKEKKWKVVEKVNSKIKS